MSTTSTPPAPTPAAVVWDSSLLRYRFSAEHPMAPLRLDLTHRLVEAFGLLDAPHVRIVEPPMNTSPRRATSTPSTRVTHVRIRSRSRAAFCARATR